ncbi:f6b6b20e-daf3-44c4-8de7-dcc19e6c7d23 [Thermothielavioides terrestris]|uniref:F6b6b20e-daf3-44c4-8de7-dcc19e6c7d23 n=1 Tax=Thermothielavioides terrestris TaxID=2587410 RepID=A0A446BUF3_9PEZI|nr:f6b6b20e-daf3-44c4-8de7-dcc19e6c7d23 [Thermothielavioides terrestris]
MLPSTYSRKTASLFSGFAPTTQPAPDLHPPRGLHPLVVVVLSVVAHTPLGGEVGSCQVLEHVGLQRVQGVAQACVLVEQVQVVCQEAVN